MGSQILIGTLDFGNCPGLTQTVDCLLSKKHNIQKSKMSKAHSGGQEVEVQLRIFSLLTLFELQDILIGLGNPWHLTAPFPTRELGN